jgi:hypothetical protein
MEHGRYKLIFLSAVATLAAGEADGFAHFVAAVVEQECR